MFPLFTDGQNPDADVGNGTGEGKGQKLVTDIAVKKDIVHCSCFKFLVSGFWFLVSGFWVVGNRSQSCHKLLKPTTHLYHQYYIKIRNRQSGIEIFGIKKALDFSKAFRVY